TNAVCAKAWNDVLRQDGIAFREIAPDDVRRVTGKPHDVCIRETFRGLPEETLRLLTERTAIEDNAAIAEHGGILYDGVSSGLAQLARAVPLFIVSNCQAGYVETFLRVHGMGAC